MILGQRKSKRGQRSSKKLLADRKGPRTLTHGSTYPCVMASSSTGGSSVKVDWEVLVLSLVLSGNSAKWTFLKFPSADQQLDQLTMNKIMHTQTCGRGSLRHFQDI